MSPADSLTPGRPPSGPPPAAGPEAETWARAAAVATEAEYRADLVRGTMDGAWSAGPDGRSAVAPGEDGQGELAVAFSDPFDADMLDAVAWAADRAVHPIVTTRAALRRAASADGAPPIEAQLGGIGANADGGDAEAVRHVDSLLLEAARRRASDIHLEPAPGRLRVRLRLDGALVETAGPPERLRSAVVSRVKLLAGMNLDERRLPQDGRLRARLDGREVDLRVATVPALRGEAVVLRLLEAEAPRRGLGELGLDSSDEGALRRLLGAGDGLVLVTGPTGAGKTTTLYACLHELNTPGRKILTVEDPVEYRLPGISQVAVHAGSGLDFAAALRAFLRQAPNVIMVGEVRDAETARLALQAALTGHLVLSTLHTRDAPGAVARLVDLGASPPLVAAALRATVAQRLVRRVCPDCAKSAPPTARELAALGASSDLAAAGCRRGAGCAACGGSGYRGRVGVFEVLQSDDSLRRLVARGAGPGELQAAAVAAGWRPLAASAGRKVLAGATTIDEFLAVASGR